MCETIGQLRLAFETESHTLLEYMQRGCRLYFIVFDKNNDIDWNSELNKTAKTQYYSKYFLYFFWMISVGRIHL